MSLRALSMILLLAACGPSEEPPDGPVDPRCLPPVVGPEEVVLGLSDGVSFQALRENTVVPMESGTQGGQHITIAVQLYPESDEKWAHTLLLASTSGEELGSSAFNARACPGSLNEWDRVLVFVHETTTTSGVLTLKSTPIGGSRMLTSTVSIRVDPLE